MGQFLGNSSSLFSHSMGHRDWWRDYFYDHPLLAQKASQAYSNMSKDKPKVFCKQCWATAVTTKSNGMKRMFSKGEELPNMTKPQLKQAVSSFYLFIYYKLYISPNFFDAVWAPDINDSGRLWMQCHAENCIQHL